MAEQAGERGRRNGRPNSFSHQELTRRIAKSLDFSLYHKARDVTLISCTVVKHKMAACARLSSLSPLPCLSHSCHMSTDIYVLWHGRYFKFTYI